MKSSDQRWHELHVGQVWKLRDRFVLIVALELESLRVRFKFMSRADELESPTLTGDMDTLGRYLTARKGRLVNSKLQAPNSREISNTNRRMAGSLG